MIPVAVIRQNEADYLSWAPGSADVELSDSDLEGVAAGFGKAGRGGNGGSGGGGGSSGGGYGSGAKRSSGGGGYGGRPAQAPRVRGGSCGPGGCN